MGQITISLAGLLPLLAFVILPAAEEDKVGVKTKDVLCNVERELDEIEDSDRGNGQLSALGFFFLCKLLQGVASATYWTLGVAYMVDALSPRMVPAALGLCYIAGYLGGFLGSMLASACLGAGRWVLLLFC